MAAPFEIPDTNMTFPLGASGFIPFEIDPNIFGVQDEEEEDPLEGV